MATPTLLLDEHGTRFDFEFLKYINPIDEEDGRKGCAVLGLPHGTILWKAGDSRRENGN